MKKVYTKGISLANKHVLMAAAAYNLKKLLAYRQFKAVAMAMQNIVSNINDINEFISSLKSRNLSSHFIKI
jgi:serine acetyltransferase